MEAQMRSVEVSSRSATGGPPVKAGAGRHTGVGLGIISAITAALPALTENLALEIAPVRVNLIAPGFVDTSPGEQAGVRVPM
jgi:NAD(P)-dependent dehydrogenase (short-subunit alcohol dehydrogenase family)